MNSAIGRIFLLILLCLTSLAEAEAPFSVGAILPLTGDGAALGTACQNGMELAREGFAQAGPDLLKIIYEDNVNTPRNTIAAFQKLRALNNAGAFITLFSEPTKAVAPLADQLHVPLMTVASDPQAFKDRKFVVNMWPSGAAEGGLLQREAKRRGYRRIARINAPQDGLTAFRRGFDAANSGDIEVVVDEEYPIDARDFRMFLTKVRAVKALDAVFVNLFFGQVGLFAKQARESGVALPLFNVETFEDKLEVELSAGALIGQWYVSADDPSAAFLSAYRSRFPGASLYTAANCHDMVLLIADALKKGRGQPQEMNGYFHSVKDFKGAQGMFSAAGGNQFSLAAAVKVVTRNGFEKAGGR